MKSKLMVLPFLSIFIVAMAIVVGSTIPEYPFAQYVLWGVSLTLCLSWLALDAQNIKNAFSTKGAKHGMNSGLTVILGCLIIIGIGFLASRPRFNKQFDVTRDSLNTLSNQSEKIVGALGSDDSFDVVTFFDGEEKKQKFSNLLELYLAAGLRANVEHIDPKADPMRAASENVTTVDTVILKLGENNARLTDFSEEKLTNALMKVLKPSSKKVYFTVGHGERSLDDQEAAGFKIIADELVSERYQIGEVNLLELGKIPDDASAVVLAGPKYDFHKQEIEILDQFLQNAKPILFLVDALTELPNLNSLTSSYGIKINDNILILRPDDPRSQILGQNNSLVTDFDEFSPVTKDFASRGAITLVIPNARSISEVSNNEKGVKPQMVARTSEIVIGVDKVKSSKDLENIGPDRIIGGPFPVIGVATGRVGGDEIAKSGAAGDIKDADGESTQTAKELRLGVIGSSEFVTNLGVQRGENIDMFLNLLNYLLQDESFISIRPKDVTKSTLDVSSAGSQFLLLFFAYIYPTTFLVGGLAYWMRRRRA